MGARRWLLFGAFAAFAASVTVLVSVAATSVVWPQSPPPAHPSMPLQAPTPMKPIKTIRGDSPPTWPPEGDLIATPNPSLEVRIFRIAGRGAINCGRLGINASDQEMHASLSCAIAATSRHVPFGVWRESAGIDSYGAEGLVGDGIAIFTFEYVQGFGQPGDFMSERCSEPVLVDRFGQTIFGCRDQSVF